MSKSYPGKILIVDDTQENIALLSNILERKHHQIAAANNGEQAIKIANKIKPDLILLDIMMPGIDGFETCRRLKNQPETKSIPVIFVSAKNEAKDIVAGFSAGGIDYINKPYYEEEVCARIESQIKIQKLNQKLKKAHNKAIEASNAKSIFLANMSHELRTPMHGILSFSNLGIKKYQQLSAAEHLKYYTYIKSSAVRLLGLINNLLDLSKLESGKMELFIQQSSLIQTVQACIDEQQARLDELEIKIHFQTECISSAIDFDPVRIGQVITNFLSNAVKYTDKGKKIDIIITHSELEANIRSESKRPATLLSIRNYGISIPEDELMLVFDKFSQSSVKINNVGGTGLGLAISKEIIEAHQGKIWLENIQEGGVAANFIIPDKQVQSP